MSSKSLYKARFGSNKTHQSMLSGLILILLVAIVLFAYYTSPPTHYDDNFPTWLKPIIEGIVPLAGIVCILTSIDDIGNSYGIIQISPDGIYYRCPLHRQRLIKWMEIESIRIASIPSVNGSLVNYEDTVIIHRTRGELNVFGHEKMRNTKEKMYIKASDMLLSELNQWFIGEIIDSRV